jgi:hypothetical protein
LDGLDLVGLLLDGVHVGEHCLIVALGLGADGSKHALGLWEGATEDATVCQGLLSNLQSRGLRTDRSLRTSPTSRWPRTAGPAWGGTAPEDGESHREARAKGADVTGCVIEELGTVTVPATPSPRGPGWPLFAVSLRYTRVEGPIVLTVSFPLRVCSKVVDEITLNSL